MLDVRMYAKCLPRLGVKISNILGDNEGLKDDVVSTDLESGDLAVRVDVLQVPVRAGHAQIELDDFVLLVSLGKGQDGAGSVGAVVGVVEGELGGGHSCLW